MDGSVDDCLECLMDIRWWMGYCKRISKVQRGDISGYAPLMLRSLLQSAKPDLESETKEI